MAPLFKSLLLPGGEPRSLSQTRRPLQRVLGTAPAADLLHPLLSSLPPQQRADGRGVRDSSQVQTEPGTDVIPSGEQKLTALTQRLNLGRVGWGLAFSNPEGQGGRMVGPLPIQMCCERVNCLQGKQGGGVVEQSVQGLGFSEHMGLVSQLCHPLPAGYLYPHSSHTRCVSAG